MTIRQRLYALALTGLLCSLVMGAVSFLGNARMAKATGDNQIGLSVLRNHLEGDMMHDALRGDVLSALLVGLGKSPESAAEVRAAFGEHAARFREVIGENEAHTVTPAIKTALQQVRPTLEEYIASADRLIATAVTDAEAGQKLLPAFLVSFERLEGELEALSELIESHGKRTEQEAHTAIRSANMMLALVLVFGVVLLLFQALWTIRRIMLPLGHAGQIAEATAKGDLGVAIEEAERQDEAGVLLRSLQVMQTDLRAMIELIKRNSQQVGQVSQQLAASGEQIAERSQQQSAAAMTMATAVSQMSGSIVEITNHAHQAQTMAAQAEMLSIEGGRIIRQVVSDMGGIAQSVQDSAQVIRALDQESEQIFGIIQVIKSIADQTNLLALNAAIEAARAGEQGRGFAVVADEVRQLAGRTSQSTQEIAQMVQRIQQSTRVAASSMETGVEQVGRGMTVTGEVERAIAEILEATLSTARLANDIARAISEQSVASNEVAQQVERIAGMAEGNSKIIAETARTTTELERFSGELCDSVQRFRL